MGAEMTHQLGYEVGAPRQGGETNSRNGSTDKTVLTEEGTVRFMVRRDRAGAFAPILIPKHGRRFTGFGDKLVAMYAPGLTVREIQGLLVDQYGTQVSPDFISRVTDAVLAEVTPWKERPLEPPFPVIFFDALRPTCTASYAEAAAEALQVFASGPLSILRFQQARSTAVSCVPWAVGNACEWFRVMHHAIHDTSAQ